MHASLHVHDVRVERVLQIIRQHLPALEGRVELPLSGWIDVHATGAAPVGMASLARSLSDDLACDVLLVEAERHLRCRHACNGEWLATHEADLPRNARAPAVAMPSRDAMRAERARALVARLAAQQAEEIAANADWLRRHAEALGIVAPPSALSRDEELQLMRQAEERLRTAQAAGQQDPALAAARLELEERRDRERSLFFEIVSEHGSLLGLGELPRTSAAPSFHEVADVMGSAGIASLSMGAPTTMPPAIAQLARSLGLSPDRIMPRALAASPFAWLP